MVAGDSLVLSVVGGSLALSIAVDSLAEADRRVEALVADNLEAAVDNEVVHRVQAACKVAMVHNKVLNAACRSVAHLCKI